MSVYIFDTDSVSQFTWWHPPLVRNVFRHLGDDLVTTVVTVDEAVSGWLNIIRKCHPPEKVEAASLRLAVTMQLLGGWDILPFTAAAVRRFQQLDRQKLNVGSNDLRIAAIALEADATVVTANLRDFTRVPGLRVEDWSR